VFDLVVLGGTVVDGTGARGRRTDVGIAGGRISALGDLVAADTRDRIDAAGRIVAPGFVDVHSHSDLTLLSAPSAPSKIHQGITTEVNGNCGMGGVPLPARQATAIRRANATIDPDLGVDWSWSDLAGYRDALEGQGIALNTAPLVGHIPLRIAVAGEAAGPLGDGERAALVRELEACLDAGAVGFSTGLMFPPAMSADRDELIAIGRAVARHDALFAAHFRNYSDQLLEGVDEILDVARQSSCRLQVSHLAVAGRRNWGKVPAALERIDRARAEGIDVAADIYPYIAGSANLSQLLPGWAQDGGAVAITERLGREADRTRILRAWETELFFGWDEIEVASLEPGLEETLGLTVEAVGGLWGIDPSLAALELIRRSENRVVMVAYGRSEDDLRAVLGHDATSIGSDGLAMDPDGASGAGRPHPRNYGCYPRFLGRYVRDQGVVPIERAIEMCTSRPAARAGLTDRGRLAEGLAADVVVFDPATIVDRATFREPGRYPVGIAHVLVAGVPVVRDGAAVEGARPGRVLLT
jgi:N-acyl-D-amino-acid deacylase